MFMIFFIWGTVFALLALTAWGSYRHHTSRANSNPLWRSITVDTLLRTVPVLVLTVTVTSLMSVGHS